MQESTELNGLLLVDKPAGWTSHDIVAKMRGVLKMKRIGHAGTLDPFATGLVILGIGKATKQLEGIMHQTKTYIATLKLGFTSDTFDSEGLITANNSIYHEPSIEVIEQALDSFRGGYEQKAPLFSAKKIQGKRLYDLARKGKAQEEMRPTKHVVIDSILVKEYQFPLLTIEVTCGSGTYIRSLADDIGGVLGTGAYCDTLRRTHSGAFKVEDAISPTAEKSLILDKIHVF